MKHTEKPELPSEGTDRPGVTTCRSAPDFVGRLWHSIRKQLAHQTTYSSRPTRLKTGVCHAAELRDKGLAVWTERSELGGWSRSESGSVLNEEDSVGCNGEGG